MKKKVSLFVVFCMVLGLMVSGVAAEQSANILIQCQDEAEKDERIRVTIAVDESTPVDVGGFQLRVYFDNDVIMPVLEDGTVENISVRSDMRDIEGERVGLIQHNLHTQDRLDELGEGMTAFDPEEGSFQVAYAYDMLVNAKTGSLFTVDFDVIGEPADSGNIYIDGTEDYNVLQEDITSDFSGANATITVAGDDPDVCEDCGEPVDDCTCEDEVDLCPDCDQPVDDCTCEDEVDLCPDCEKEVCECPITCPYCDEELDYCECDPTTIIVDELFDEEGNLVEGITEEYLDSLYNTVMEMEEGEDRDELVAELMKAYVALGVHANTDYDKAWEECADFVEARDAVYALFDEDWNLRDDVTKEDIEDAQELVDALDDGDAKDYLQALIDGAEKKKDKEHPGTGSEMLPFLLIGGLLAIIGGALVLPVKKLRKQ